MKKKILSLLLALVMVAAVFGPLSLTASAASDPTIRIIWRNSGAGFTYKEYKPSKTASGTVEFPELSSAYGGAITASVIGTTLVIRLNDFHPKTDDDAYYGIHVKTPSNKWNVLLNAIGDNRLGVSGSSYFDFDAAFATNGTLSVYTSEYNSYLYFYDTLGTDDKPASINSDRYGLAGWYIDVGSISANGRRLHMTGYVNLKMTGSTSSSVYPFHVTGKNQTVTLYGVDFNYYHYANYRHSYGSAPIELEGSTHLRTTFNTSNVFQQNWAFYILRYMKSFTGIMNAELKNAALYGGPYSCEGTEDSVGLAAIFDQIHAATIGDTTFIHKVAKNCTISTEAVNTIKNEDLKNALALPIAYGYALPEKVERPEFVAKLDWVDDENNDMNGTKADYGVKYTAKVQLVPKYLYRQNKKLDTVQDELKSIIPSNALGVRLITNTAPYTSSFEMMYKPIDRPALAITKQPVDYVGSGSNKTARFEIAANDSTATYQWQVYSSTLRRWIDLKDSYSASGTINIAGAKGKTLLVNYNIVNVTDGDTFRCVVSRPSDSATVTSNTVKYTYAAPSTLTELTVGGFNDQPGAGDTFYDSPYVMSDGQNVSWSGGGDNYKVQLVSHLWYEGAAGAADPAKTTDAKFIEGKTYTYRLRIRPASSKVVFASSMTILRDNSSLMPTKITKNSDGSWSVDYTFGPIGEVIRQVYLYNVVPPYNGMGFIDPTVREDAAYKLDPVFTRGWFKPDTYQSEMPQIGQQYTMQVFLYANDGNVFSAVNGKPSVTLADMRDRDGNALYAEKTEFTFGRFSDGSPDLRRLYIDITLTCKETHIIKGGTIKDLDMPTAGVKLDTEVTRSTPQIDFQEMTYYINGEKVTDPANTAPDEGDVVKIEFTFKEYGEGDTKMHFDKGIYTTWFVGGNDDENAVRVYRDTSYPDKDICAFSYIVAVPAAVAHKITVTDGKTDKNSAKPGETVTVTANDAPEGKVFDKWEIVKGTPDLKDPTKASLSFKMPNHDVMLQATYKDKPAVADVMLGDVDDDGDVTAADARLALRAAVSLENYAAGTRAFKAADVDMDEVLTAADARLILRRAVGFTDAEWGVKQ